MRLSILSSLEVVFVLFVGDNADRIWRSNLSSCTVTSDSKLLETFDIVVLSGSCWPRWRWSIWLHITISWAKVGVEVQV